MLLAVPFVVLACAAVSDGDFPLLLVTVGVGLFVFL